ncbi:biopolymer transporter ExbB [Rubellimicrobium sp. CFH 75288]|uniref:biopolymer transporter ExbB n=1 Tax=Rubellimicrobium sp. CFH 75288 TaxID=2697034 RepID=UPI0014134345|nr:biopolymer transporter ExbB [Rubellimicrobium sp. CFH 75288]NAZ36006.1 biopolymer transporter ExbB [Rubellimicrobium sp. CFH 75288]
MERRDPPAAPHFSQPVRQITLMILVLGLVSAGAYLGFQQLERVFFTNIYLNAVILFVFALGVLGCFRQVFILMRSVSWIEDFTSLEPGQEIRPPPSMLAPLAALLRTRGARMQLTATSTRTILDSVATRVDEDQDITRYLSNTLIFLGLLGTFYGLAITVPALVDTIRSLSPAPGDTGTDIFNRLQQGLETQLGGMGTAFSSSLLGLAGSLIVGLLELFAGHGQNRFYRELEEWLSSITRVGLSGEEGGSAESSVLGQVVDHMAEQMESLQMMFTQSDIARAQTDRRLGDLAAAVGELARRLDERDTSPVLARIAEGQERTIAALGQLGGQMAEGGIDPESRMRLRSIDVQLLRILEEISAGRQETTAELRADLAALARSLRGAARLRDETR